MRNVDWIAALFVVTLSSAGCSGSSGGAIPGGDGGVVSSTDDAKRAYLGLDASIDKAITLGFAGFNAASSANISPQSATGTTTGTITVTGQVDQGQSSNKTMRLQEALAAYSDDGLVSYATSTPLPSLGMTLNKIPNGTLSGSLSGDFAMSGGLSGTVTLALTFTGDLEPSPADASQVARKPGTTHIVGTATSPAGTYTVDVTR